MPISTTNLVNVIQQNKSKRVAVSKIIETNPITLPVLPKLTTEPGQEGKVDNDTRQINRAKLEEVYERIGGIKENNKNIIQLFPDIELAIQILVSSILSPKKMTDVQLNYRLTKKTTIDPTVSAGLLSTIKEYIEDNYEIEDDLPLIIREALFTSGACPYIIIPESSLDDIINADLITSYSAEAFKDKVDLILHRVTAPRNLIQLQVKENTTLTGNNIKAEDLVNHLVCENYLNVTDNPMIISFSDIKEKISSTIIKSEMRRGRGISTENLEKINYLDVFRSRNKQTGKQLEYVKTKDETTRKALGRPMVMKLPTESVIPVFTPGNETDHVGYFVLLDETGKPVKHSSGRSEASRLDRTMTASTTTLTPVQKAYQNLISKSEDGLDIDGLFEMYKDVLEKQLFNTVRSSLYGKAIDISEKNDIYFLMFCRALQNQQTTVLYVPSEMMVYYAFQYNELGVGKSLLENLAVQSSMRAILLFSKVMAFAKKSIDVTRVNISLDPNDPDPEKTIEQVQSSVLKLRQNYFPLGINNPVDLVNWIQRAGLQFSYENNPRLPNVGITFENNNIDHTLPDSDLEEDLRKQTIIALGLPPEVVDNSFSPDFARNVVNNNILLSKRITVYQNKLNKDISKFVSTLIYCDEDLRNEIREHLISKLDNLGRSLEEEEKQLLSKDKDSFLEYYINKLSDEVYVELPKAEETDISNLSIEFDLYKENLDKVIEAVISTEMFPSDVVGDVSDHLESIKVLYKNHLLRQWMTNNNYYPEVLELSNTDTDEVDGMLVSLIGHTVATMRNSTKLLDMVKEYRQASSNDIKTIYSEREDSSSEPTENEPTQADEDDGLGGDADDLLDL